MLTILPLPTFRSITPSAHSGTNVNSVPFLWGGDNVLVSNKFESLTRNLALKTYFLSPFPDNQKII